MQAISKKITPLSGMMLIVFCFFMGISYAEGPSCIPPPPDMSGWWPGDGDSADIIGGNNGMLQNGATFASGKVGQAFAFAAAGDGVQIAHNPSLNLESLSSSTFEGWFKSKGGSVSGDALVIAKHFCGLSTGWFFTTDQGCFIGDHYVGGVGVGSLNLDDDQFHHFACVKDGTIYREYLDGVLTSQDTGPDFGTSNKESVYIGNITTGTCSPDKMQLFGLIDEIGIYNRALSTTEIQSIFLAGSSGKCKEPSIPVYVSLSPGCGGKKPCYNVLQTAIDSSESFSVINVTDETYTQGDVVFDGPKFFTLWGGWDPGFTTCTSDTVIQGSLTVSNGKVIVQYVTLR